MNLLFETECKLGKKVRISEEHWKLICKIKHPEVAGLKNEILDTLCSPIQIKRSSSDKDVYLYYSKFNTNFLCVVARHLNGNGFIITAYITSKIKQGDIIWKQ